MAESLKGVRGWLLFFVICFGIAGLGYVTAFFASLTNLSGVEEVVDLLFSPILATLAIATTVTIAMEKRLGKWLAIAFFGVAALYSIVDSIATFAVRGGEATMLVSTIIAGVVGTGLFSLYFFVSKRVKETLIK